MNKLKIIGGIILSLVLFAIPFLMFLDVLQLQSAGANKSQFTTQVEIYPDLILLKQTEMLNTIVHVSTYFASGSGTIINRTHNDSKNQQTKNVSIYSILTNAHVIEDRNIKILVGADGLRGEPLFLTIDYEVIITAFRTNGKVAVCGSAVVVTESEILDLAILTFETDVDLPVANLPSCEMLDQIRIFDEVYAVGCQLGRPPLPTDGIISSIVGTANGHITYTSNAQIAGGSSGGGLFKKYGGHYYLIGVPFSAPFARNGQFLPHLASAISLVSANEMIKQYIEEK